MRLPRLKRLLRSTFTKKNFALATITTLLLGGVFFLWAASLEVPDMRQVVSRRVNQSTKIYDRTGEVLLYDLSQNITRTIIPIDQISPLIQKATVSIEDEEFYTHAGVKPTAYLRAIWVDITTLSLSQGGSTITQQVVKNTLLTKDKTPARKIKEMVLALKIERVLTKDQILELYLNENPYGGSIYGVEEASKTFFNKHASEVTLAEAAYLAALPQAPSYYSPYGNHRDRLEARKNLVLTRMYENGHIRLSELEAAKKEEVIFETQKARGITAPHFVFYVQEQLEARYGSRALEDGGYKVITTLDAELQATAQGIVKKYALENASKFNASNAAMVAIDPKSGDILVMVGSRNYFDTGIPGNFNIAVASRQPGSSFKPFVYAAAFEKGYTPETVLFDVRTQFSTSCNPTDISNSEAPCYSPVNYDGKFRGPVTLRAALAESLNIPSVKLLYLTGINNALRMAKSLGVTTLSSAAHYGLTLVLGGGEVRLLDMVSGYGAFAQNGYHLDSRAILEVQDANGVVIDKTSSSGTQVMPQSVASQINDVLSDNNARAPSYGYSSALYFGGRDVAVKTGTTNDYRDAWVIGYTPNLVVGSWAGNNDNSPMEKKVAGLIVAPMWHDFMQHAIDNRPAESFIRAEPEALTLPPPLRGIWQGGLSEVVDSRTGVPASFDTPAEFRQERVSGGVHSILYWIDKDNPQGARPTNPGDDPQFRFWEAGVRTWASLGGHGSDQPLLLQSPTGVGIPAPLPTSSEGVPSSELAIKNPANGLVVPLNEPLLVSVESPHTLSSVVFSINGISLGTVTLAPFSITIVPGSLPNTLPSGNSIVARATTPTGGVFLTQSSFGTK